jgi:hypothetical protein
MGGIISVLSFVYIKDTVLHDIWISRYIMENDKKVIMVDPDYIRYHSLERGINDTRNEIQCKW